MTLPTFLVIGAARSGTTALVEGLRTHPEVFVTEPKEPHYFGLHGIRPEFTAPGDRATINRVAVTDREAYLGLYPAQHNFSALGDGSVSTLYYYRHAIPEVCALAPGIKVVVMLREPVGRAHSAFSYLSARGFEPCSDFLDAVADEDRRVAANWHHLWHYTRMSRYADGVAAFQQALGHDRVGIWFYDQLNTDYVGTVKEVLRFIDVAEHPDEGLGMSVVNASGSPRSQLLHAGVRTLTRNEPLRRTVKRMTSYRLRERVRSRLLKPDGVGAEARERLQPLFIEDLRQLLPLISSDRAPEWLIRWGAPHDL